MTSQRWLSPLRGVIRELESYFSKADFGSDLNPNLKKRLTSKKQLEQFTSDSQYLQVILTNPLQKKNRNDCLTRCAGYLMPIRCNSVYYSHLGLGEWDVLVTNDCSVAAL